MNWPFKGIWSQARCIDNVRGITYDTMIWRREHLYRSQRGTKPEPGVTYTVRVSAPGYPSVEATGRIPDSPAITLEAFKITDPSGFNSQFLEITSVIRDNPDQNDFYMAGASYPLMELHGRPDGSYDTVYHQQFAWLETVDIQSIYLQQFKLFSDQSFFWNYLSLKVWIRIG